MNTAMPRLRGRPRALALSALAGVLLAAILFFGADKASAAFTARVQAGTLKVTGDEADDKLALRLRPGSPATLEVDVGEDGSADFSFDRKWDPGDASDIVEGQGGHDQLDFNGSNIGEQIQLSANGPRLLLTRNITIGNLTGTDVKTVDIDLDASAGGGDTAAETITVAGTDGRDVVQVTRAGSQVSVAGLPAETRIVGSEPTNDTLTVQTLDGKTTSRSHRTSAI
jgi:hypothetical protein